MFVVWRTGRRDLSARLVESRRVGGRPRQRFIAVLGSVPLRWTTTEPPNTSITTLFCQFWSGVDEVLAGLVIDPEERRRNHCRHRGKGAATLG